MPYRKLQEEVKEEVEARLAKELAREISEPTESGVSSVVQNPLVIEHLTKQQRLHFIVVWDNPEWRTLDLLERSSVIMKALHQSSEDKIQKLHVTLGLTSEEAPRFGINVEDVLEHGEKVSAKVV